MGSELSPFWLLPVDRTRRYWNRSPRASTAFQRALLLAGRREALADGLGVAFEREGQKVVSSGGRAVAERVVRRDHGAAPAEVEAQKHVRARFDHHLPALPAHHGFLHARRHAWKRVRKRAKNAPGVTRERHHTRHQKNKVCTREWLLYRFYRRR